MSMRVVDIQHIRERLDDVERQMSECVGVGSDFERERLKYLQAAHDYLLSEARRLIGGGVEIADQLPRSANDTTNIER